MTTTVGVVVVFFVVVVMMVVVMVVVVVQTQHRGRQRWQRWEINLRHTHARTHARTHAPTAMQTHNDTHAARDQHVDYALDRQSNNCRMRRERGSGPSSTTPHQASRYHASHPTPNATR